jgi:hypothetical protein
VLDFKHFCNAFKQSICLFIAALTSDAVLMLTSLSPDLIATTILSDNPISAAIRALS